jgi:hypothetical protein
MSKKTTVKNIKTQSTRIINSKPNPTFSTPAENEKWIRDLQLKNYKRKIISFLDKRDLFNEIYI